MQGRDDDEFVDLFRVISWMKAAPISVTRAVNFLLSGNPDTDRPVAGRWVHGLLGGLLRVGPSAQFRKPPTINYDIRIS